MNRFLRIALLGLVLAPFLSFAACNTTRGAGQDIEKGGQAIQRSAEKHGAD